MAQTILKRRLNPLLLISTVAALSLLAGVSVLYQDQIASMRENVTQTTEKINQLKEKVQELSVEKENLTRRITGLNQTLTTVRNKLEKKKNILENKTEKIQDLQQKLDQQQDFQTVNQGSSDQLREMNASLQVLCEWGEAVSQDKRPSLEAQCQKWGHSLGG